MPIPSYTPSGLNPVKYLNGALWNGQVSQYRIKSGYNFNIFRGDPIIMGTATGVNPLPGYILSYADFAGTAYKSGTPVIGNIPTLGVFVGCSYQDVAGVNPADPASPGRQFWAANTATLSGMDVTAYVIDDPNVVYEIQALIATSASDSMRRAIYSGLVAATNPTTTQQNGVSSVGFAGVQTANALGTGPCDLRLIRMSGDSRNQDAAVNNIWEVVLNNSYFAARSAV